MEFMSTVREVVKTRQSQKNRKEGESRGILSFLSLGQWTKENHDRVKLAIQANPEMFSRIMKEANKTLDTYIKTRTWNTVYWLASWEDRGQESEFIRFYSSSTRNYQHAEVLFDLKVHLVWAPSDGFRMDQQEQAQFNRRKDQTIRNLRNGGYIVWGQGKDKTPVKKEFYTRAKTVSKNDSYEMKITTHRGNVFSLLAEFLGFWEDVSWLYYGQDKLPYCLELIWECLE
jgi:hypothetical protein